jgi:very-short-patch-repair endonuclease
MPSAPKFAAAACFPSTGGVFRVGPGPLTQHGIWMAATLAGEDFHLSHEHGLALMGVLEAPNGPPHVSTNGHARTRPGKLIVHRIAFHPEDDTRIWNSVPTLNLPRCLTDYAELPTTTDRDLEHALDRAHVERLLQPHLESLTQCRSSRRGAKRLERILTQHTPGTTITKSVLEKALLGLIRSRPLPHPDAMNTEAAGINVDALYRQQRVAIELDSWGAHGLPPTQLRDYAKTAQLEAAGYHVLRFTYWQVTQEPQIVIAAITAALRARAAA